MIKYFVRKQKTAFVRLFIGSAMISRRHSNYLRGMRLFVYYSLPAFMACLPLADIESGEPFSVRLADSTISPFGPVRICFNNPIVHPDSIRFSFKPRFEEYRQIVNASHDTVTLELTIPLAGDARYTLLLSTYVESEDGSLIVPGEDTLPFSTFPMEQEPNDSRSTADTLNEIMFGSVSAANDTDWFAIGDTAAAACYLKSTGSSSFFALRDAGGSSVCPPGFSVAETLTVPRSFKKPLYGTVFAFNRSNGGSYELGVVKR
jgi:hypothetical protein